MSRVRVTGTASMLARVRCRRLLAPFVLLGATAAFGAEPSRGDLADLSLEELSNLEITSVSKHAERLSDAPASIFVITGDDIRRSGVTSLPDALRLAPNLEVARVNANSYAISARGFNSTTANKLLVLIDGRAVYTPLFSGVFWDAQDVMLEDVDRIEVISGPGATLWGANAVNGVINVITRAARDTQGGLAAGGSGNLESTGAFRYGGQTGDDGHYRVYGKGFRRDNTQLANGNDARDSWERGQVGFRSDWGTSANGFTLQGDAYQGAEDQTTPANPDPGKIHISGGNLLGRWNRDLAEAGQLRLQTYIDNTDRTIPGIFAERLNILDLEFQHNLRPLGAHGVTWGGGYRFGDDHVTNSAALAFLPPDRDLRWSNVFAQDEIALKQSLRLTLGGKLEYNYYTGTDFLPSARLAWKPEPTQLLWGAVSRAVRAPSRIDRDFFTPPPFQISGGPDFVSEVTNVIEAGYRATPSPRASYSVSLFHNIHDKLRSIEPAGGGAFVLANKMEGTTTGLETWGTFQAARNWRLSAGAVFLRQRLRLEPDSGDPIGVSAAGNDPAHQWTLRSSLDLSERTELDVGLRRVGALPNPSVPAYTAVDIRYGWRPRRNLEISLVGQNLADPGHPEFGQPATRSEIARGVFLKLQWTI
jgi:iron complex outermembrane recepter protein